jgi:replicative DNA helicase
VDSIVDQVEQLIFNVAERRLGDRFSHIRDLLHDHLEQVEALQLRGSSVTGVPTGFVDLDNLTSGLQGSNLIIVAGRPSFGKTSFALNVAQFAATDHQVPVAIFSLEMSKMELVQRLVCAEALVDVHKLRVGNLNDNDWSRLANAVGRLADAPIYIDDTEALGVLEIRAKARRLKQKADLGLVIVDYLQLMQGPRRSENRQQEISEISRSLKILARELNVPVIAVSQLSRNVEYRADKRPMLADLRESGSIEQDADVVVFIYRDEVYNPDTTDKGVAEVLVAKHRNGPVGRLKLTFLENYTKFANHSGGM